MANITITVNEDKIQKMKDFYEDFIQEVNNPYIVFSAKVDGCVINLYTSNKCTFQGEYAEDEALIWQDLEEESITASEWKVRVNHMGSDEVGTGDFFGPVVVCATYVSEEDIPWLTSIGVTDSKKLTDEKIIDLANKIMNRIPFSYLVCDNLTYNKQIAKGLNMNSIKAILHNRVLLNIIKKKNLDNPYIIMDQFAEKDLYYSYLKNIKDPVVKNIVFKTKGETYAPAIACASIIARYKFIEKMNELSKEYKLGDIPKGASQLVDIFGQLFVKTYGFEKLEQIAKMNFKNVDKIKNPLEKLF